MRARGAGPGGRVARGALVALAAFAVGARAYPTSSDDVPRGTASSLPYSDYHTLPATPGTPTPGAAGVSQWATAFDGEDGFLAAARAAARGDAEDITGGSPEYSKLPPPAYPGPAATAWPMFGGGVMHKGRQDVFDPGYLGRRGRRTPVVQWTMEESQGGFASGPVQGPLDTGGMIFVGSRDQYVYAVNASTGAVVWRYHTSGAVLGTPVVGNRIGTDDGVFAPSTDGECHAISATHGTFRYRFARGGLHLGGRWVLHSNEPLVSSPVIASNGVLYLGATDGHVYALNSATGSGGAAGSIKWMFATKSPVTASPALAVNDSADGMSGAGMLYVGALDGTMYALDAARGEKVWSFSTGGAVHSSVTLSESGHAIFGSFDGFLYCLNATDGGLAWRFRTGGGVTSSPALNANETSAFIVSTDRQLYAVRMEDGQLVWNRTLVRDSSLLEGADGKVPPEGYVDMGMGDVNVDVDEIDAVDDGAAETYSPKATVDELPLRDRPQLSYAASGDITGASLMSFLQHEGVCPPMSKGGSDARLDRRLGMRPSLVCGGADMRANVAAGVSATPVYAGGIVFVGSEDRSMYALEEDTGKVLWAFPTNGAITAPAMLTEDNRLIFGSEDGVLYSLIL